MQTVQQTQALVIVQQAPEVLVAEQNQPSAHGLGMSALAIVLVVAGLGFLVWKRRWIGAVVVLAIVFLSAFLQSPSSANKIRLTLKPLVGTVTWESLRGDRVADTTTANAGEFRTADLDRLDDHRERLVLTRWSGGQEFPLGSDYHEAGAAEQVVLEQLRSMLVAGRNSTSDHTDSSKP